MDYLFPIKGSHQIGNVLFNSNGSQIEQVKIYSVAGKMLLYKTGLSENNVTIDISNLPIGVYFTEIIIGSERIRKKIVISR